MNISLIGMSGAGKSYIGRMVADTLDLLFVDIDSALEQDFGRSLPEILTDIGDTAFIRAESAATIAQSEDRDGILISTGGSVVYSPEAMLHLQAVSRVVYLRVPKAVLMNRVAGNEDRIGRIVGMGEKSLEELIDEREPLYESFAHAIVEAGDSEPGHIVQAIIDAASG